MGDSIGANGTKVIYKGSASYLDHVMPSGLTHYYVFYSYSGNYYSPGVTNSAALTAYLAYIVLAALAVAAGARIVRCHDVAETVDAVRVAWAVSNGEP